MIRKYYDDGDSVRDFAAEYERQRQPIDPATLKEYVKLHAPRMADVSTVQHLADITQSKRVSERLMSMQWHMGRIMELRTRFSRPTGHWS
jgi:hypothetical protein